MDSQVRALLSSINASLRACSPHSLQGNSHGNDLYEVYLFTQVVRAAQAAGASVSFETVHGAPASQLLFRTSPGRIFWSSQPFTHAVLEFDGARPLEVHVGVRVYGKSQVTHEADVSVIDRQEGIRCRNIQDDPRAAKVQLAIEAKFYSTNLTLSLAREFLGLTVDLSAKHAYFVSNSSSHSLARILTARGRDWWCSTAPGSAPAARLRSRLEDVFQRYQS